MRRLTLTTFAVLLAACSDAVPPSAPPVTTSSAPATTASSREILTDLRRWDAATSESRRAAAEDVARRLPDFALSRMETFSSGGQTHEVAIYSHAKTGMEFVLVPVGTFQTSDPPMHDVVQVTLTKPFLIARTHCTQATYEKLTGTNPSNSEGPTLPVECVSWDDAKLFCAKVGLELPTETQWECACRAGTTTRYCFGETATTLGDYAWYSENADGTTHPVGEKKPNAFGLYDMHGNASQWCESSDGDSPTNSPTSEKIACSGGKATDRIFRGANWSDSADYVSSTCLGWGPKDDGSMFIGFRPAKTVPSE